MGRRAITNNLHLPDHLTVVYVIAPDVDGPCKIGITKNIQERILSIQNGCWLPLKIADVRIAISKNGGSFHQSMARAIAASARELEKATHRKLKELDVHLHGEWFDVSARDAIRAIEKIAVMQQMGVVSVEQAAGANIRPTDSGAMTAQTRIVRSLASIAVFRDGAGLNLVVD